MTASGPLERYHQVLQAVSAAPSGMNLQALQAAAQLPRSSAHRIAAALCDIEYLALDASGLYTLGPAFQELLRRSLVSDKHVEAFLPALRFLVAELGESAFYARLVDGKVDLVRALTPSTGERSFVYPGTGPRPLDTCSSSKAILAYQDLDVVHQMFLGGQLPHGPESTWERWVSALRGVGEKGYAVCDGEIEEGVFSLSCPVHVGPIRGLYSIGAVGPAQRMKDKPLEHLVATIERAAAMAAQELVGTGHA